MDKKLFKEVSEVLSSRLTLAGVTALLLSVLVVFQQYYIQSRSEIVIQQPMFSLDKELKYVRDEMTESVAQVWAFNAVLLYGNVNQQSVKLMDAVAYSFVDSKLATELKQAHEEQLRYMSEQDVTISFVPDGNINYDPVSEWVTITGTRTVKAIDPESEIEDIKNRYMFKVKMAMTDFRPWVSGWKEGQINE